MGRNHEYPVVLHCPERSEEQMIVDMETAVRDGGRPNGMTTVSPLINMPKFNIVWGFVPDYMHYMLLAVGRQFLTMWLKLCFTPDKRKEVDKRIKMLAPPKEVRRMPRPTSQKLFWKAKVWENWILFFSLPVLKGLLENKYLHHWVYFVDALNILLQEKVSLSDLDVVEEQLAHFYGHAKILHGAECMTSWNAERSTERLNPPLSLSTSFSSTFPSLLFLHCKSGCAEPFGMSLWPFQHTPALLG